MYGMKGLVVFSRRRRHRRWNCDWSSDVCSSDLRYPPRAWGGAQRLSPDTYYLSLYYLYQVLKFFADQCVHGVVSFNRQPNGISSFQVASDDILQRNIT